MHSLKFFIQYFSLQRANFSFQIGGKEKSSHRKRRIEKPRRDVNPPFYRENLIRRGKEEALRKGKSEEFPHLVRGTPIIYRLLFLICKREILIRGRSVRRGEETQKRLLPIQVRTASFFLLNGKGRDYFEVRATVSRAIMSSSSVGITTTFTLLSLVESRASSPCIFALSSLSISIPIYCISSQTYSRVVV